MKVIVIWFVALKALKGLLENSYREKSKDLTVKSFLLKTELVLISFSFIFYYP